MVVCSSCMAPFEDCTCGFYQKIELDDNIADIVMLLNHKGYQTRFSCEGHTEQVCEPGAIGTYVLFEKPIQRCGIAGRFPKSDAERAE